MQQQDGGAGAKKKFQFTYDKIVAVVALLLAIIAVVLAVLLSM